MKIGDFKKENNTCEKLLESISTVGQPLIIICESYTKN